MVLSSFYLRISFMHSVNPTVMMTVAATLGLKDFDLLMMADGSGITLEKACGWACYVWDKKSGEFWGHVGATNSGTNNYAELSPFLHGLWHWHQTKFPNVLPRPKNVKVELVSDSEITVKCGNGVYGRNTNLPLWNSVDWYKNNGYILHWNHVIRNSNPVHKEADRQSRDMRLLVEKYVAS
jgi:ribonuclease HI